MLSYLTENILDTNQEYNSVTVLVVEQNNYVTKTVNAYIVYELGNWPRILLDNFIFKKLV